MKKNISYSGGKIVVGRDFINYKEVLEDFKNARCIRIITYNISKNNYRNELIDALKMVAEDVDVKIISNIPSRMKNYYNSHGGDKMRSNYRKSFSAYLERLNPENFHSNPEVSFNFTNHAKIIGTENVLYIGSANYSDESKDNIEAGTIIRDKEAIKKMYQEVFPAVIDESTPYFEDDFNVLRLFIISMENKFKWWLREFDEKLLWKNETTGIKGVSEQFSLDEDGLIELHDIIDELNSICILLDNTYTEFDEEYNELTEKIQEALTNISIGWMLDFTQINSELFDFIMYDEEEKTLEYLQDDPEAYDENLDACVEIAMNNARDEFESMRNALENDLFFFRDEIEKIVAFLQRVHKRTLEYSDKWIKEKVDNT